MTGHDDRNDDRDPTDIVVLLSLALCAFTVLYLYWQIARTW